MPARPLRVLALDHYFDQDLRELEQHPALRVRRLPFERLRRPAIRIMGTGVTHGLESFTRPEFESSRQRYARWLERELRRIYLEDPFDIIVLPNDQFFYVRALPQVSHAIGVPIVVVQKETTISPETMANASLVDAVYAPFISDRMTVCSERQREFWLQAGADPALITVVGQPRFDVYAAAAPPIPAGVPSVLFFSYAIDAYAANAELGRAIWQELRGQTESVLAEMARDGSIRVVVKFHPQQDRSGERERLQRVAGSAWGTTFLLVDPETDTRRLVLDADVVVGFQTTALYEAAAARRPVVYAAWGDAWERRKDRLIPFHAAPPDSLHRATGPDELRQLLCSRLEPAAPSARPWFEEALGPVDGRACERTVEILAEIARDHASVRRPTDLLGRRRRFAGRLLVRSLLLEMLWLVARVPASLLGRTAGVAARYDRARQFRRLAVEGLRQGPDVR